MVLSQLFLSPKYFIWPQNWFRPQKRLDVFFSRKMCVCSFSGWFCHLLLKKTDVQNKQPRTPEIAVAAVKRQGHGATRLWVSCGAVFEAAQLLFLGDESQDVWLNPWINQWIYQHLKTNMAIYGKSLVFNRTYSFKWLGFPLLCWFSGV